jgi:hypothetical protein
MGAPLGNQYWKARAKHGRDRIINDCVLLAENIDEYFTWCVENPIFQVDFRGKDLLEVNIPHPRVFKKEELARFIGLSQWRLVKDLEVLSKDFSQVIKETENIIADQKYTYAVVGMFNSNIIARDLGLSDKSEIQVNKPIMLDWSEHEGTTNNHTTNPEAEGSGESSGG